MFRFNTLVAFFILLISVHSFKLIQIDKNSKPVQFLISQHQEISPKSSKVKTTLYYLGIKYYKQIDHLNKTFDLLNRLNFTYAQQISSDDRTFRIEEANPSYSYIGLNQKIETESYGSYYIQGDTATLTLNFNWNIKNGSNTINGIGKASGTLTDITYAAWVRQNSDSGFYESTVLDIVNPTFSNLNITSTTPIISDSDVDFLSKILNTQTKSIQQQIKGDFQTYYLPYLNNTVIAQNPFSKNFSKINYQWKPTSVREPFNFTFIKTPIALYTSRQYMLMAYNFVNDTFPEVPPMKIYSDMQQFYPYSFYQQFLTEALAKGALNSVLDKNIWSTKDFKFVAGDLFPIFNNIDKNFVQNDEVSIVCNAIKDSIGVDFPSTNATGPQFRVFINWECSVSITQKPVMKVDVSLFLKIEGQPKSTFIDYQLTDLQSSSIFYSSQGYTAKDFTQAQNFVEQIANKLKESKLLGSGFPFELPYKEARFLANQDGTIIYDQTYS